jgi:uncharacterized protein YifN (PemK superfamily)
MWKGRPVIVIATDRSLGGTVTVVPCSSQDQTGNEWAVRLDTPIDGKGPSWAICDKPHFLLPRLIFYKTPFAITERYLHNDRLD